MKISQLNKLAFICNLAFLLAMAMRYYPVFQGSTLESVILVTGLVIAPFVNSILLLYRIYLYFTGSGVMDGRLFWINLIIACLQGILILFFSGVFSFNSFAHDSSYH